MLTGYCAGWSLKQLIREGLGGIPGKITSSPARHLSVLCSQMDSPIQCNIAKWCLGSPATRCIDPINERLNTLFDFTIRKVVRLHKRSKICIKRRKCLRTNSDMQPSDVRSMCCRLRLDLRELRKKTGGFFGSGESTGSVGVVTINLPRIAYLAVDEADFYKRLDRLMDVSARSLKIKRNVISKLLEEGLYPYTKRYLGKFDNHFSTIGLIGMNEAGLNAKWLRADLSHKKVQQFAKDVLNHMRERLADYQEQYGDLYNLEATPAESTTYRLAKHDKERWSDIITAGNEGDKPYYTNSSHLPVDYTTDIFDALDIQDELQTLYTSDS